jgi:AraC-like DNA-binding protein
MPETQVQSILRMPADFREIQHIGADTPEQIVPGRACPALATHRIGLTGLTDAGRGYRIGRHAPSFAQVLVTTGGEGRVWIDDGFVPIRPGEAYLSPACAPCAIHTVPGTRWQFCWVHYREPVGQRAMIVGDASRCVRTDGWFIATAILGLYREWVSGGSAPGTAPAMDRWVELLQSYVTRLVRPDAADSLLRAVWERVDARLDHPWTLLQLSRLAGLSIESLRQHSLRETGRPPMAHVTQLRLSRAAVMLQTTTHPVAAIAAAVGYATEAAFSTAFKRVFGTPPSAYRRQARG